MKIASVVLLAVCLALTPFFFFQDNGMKRALELYIPIACTGPDFGFKYTVGTGFPVGKNLVMTAKHVDCGYNNITEISFDNGKTWEWIQEADILVSVDADIRIYKTRSDYQHSPATFRKAVLGETTYGYGVAFNIIGTTGHVLRSDQDGVIVTNTAAGGMSGSALVTADGEVVGMTVQAQATRVGYKPTSYVSYAIPVQILQEQLEILKKGQPQYNPVPPPVPDTTRVPSPDDPIILPLPHYPR